MTGERESQAGKTTKEQEADTDTDALRQHTIDTQQAVRIDTQHSRQSVQGIITFTVWGEKHPMVSSMERMRRTYSSWEHPQWDIEIMQ